MTQVMYDLDVLRSFSTGIALGSYARAADRLGRSTSAVSAQLKKLEAQSGTALFRKAGRGLELTDAGRTLLAYAHRLLELNEEAVTAVRGTELQGVVRLGLQEDLGEAVLPAALGRFARAHPRVRIEASVLRSTALRERLAAGQLDLALLWDLGLAETGLPTERVVRLPLQWIGPAGDVAPPLPASTAGRRTAREPLPLVLLDAPCPLREIVTAALDRAGRPWRHAFSSSSVAGLWAATAAGLGLTVRTALGVPASVRALERAGTGLPALPAMNLVLCHAREAPEAPERQLGTLLVEAVRAQVPAGSAGPSGLAGGAASR